MYILWLFMIKIIFVISFFIIHLHAIFFYKKFIFVLLNFTLNGLSLKEYIKFCYIIHLGYTTHLDQYL